MTKAIIKMWIKHDPSTGKKRPFECWAQVDGGKARCTASYKTEEAAQKGVKLDASINAEFYQVEMI